IPRNLPRLQNITVDGNVLLFTVLIAVLTGVLFGLVPAWQASRANLADALNDAGRASSARRGNRSNRLLVMAEVALVAMLLIGAVLMLQSFRHLLAIDPGFRPEGVATFDLSLPYARYDDGVKRVQFYEQARLQLSGLPGVHWVGEISNLPLSGNENITFL